MVHPFISSPTADTPSGPLGRVSLSVVVHTVLIAGAVAATTPSPTLLTAEGDVDRRPIEHVRFIRAVPVSRARATDNAGRRHATKSASHSLVLHSPIAEPILAREIAPIVTPDLDLESEMTEWAPHQFEDVTAGAAIRDAVRRMYATPVDGAYDREVVEKMVWPRPNNPRPSYPSSLLSAGVEAHIVAHFVVDSTGRVSEKSLTFPETAHRLFVEAIKRALLRSRYFPAELAGRRVSQRVIQEFVFRVER
jgi:hypothetical protein